MANAEEQPKGMTKLFEGFYQSQPRPTATAQSLKLLAETLGRELTRPVVEVYLALLNEFTDRELIQTFSRAMNECKFFPVPATLREFSGRPASGDLVANEAKEELEKLIVGMRGPHGPTLRPILGRFLYGKQDDPKNANGERVPECDAPRAESTVFPIARRTEAALVRLGWGSREAGISLIVEHPAVRRKQHDPGDEQYRQNQLRVADEILKRFDASYREVQ